MSALGAIFPSGSSSSPSLDGVGEAGRGGGRVQGADRDGVGGQDADGQGDLPTPLLRTRHHLQGEAALEPEVSPKFRATRTQQRPVP